jgi:nucleotidyltransferase substrate binding protein (TIGR01987 family)
MESRDIRWEQRFSNYKRALTKLKEVVQKAKDETLSELEREGMIQRFEYTYELAWKTLQDLFKYKGYTDVIGPTPVLNRAFQDGYITDGEGWKAMKKSRELTSHTYDDQTAEDIAEDIIEFYYDLFSYLYERLEKERHTN